VAGIVVFSPQNEKAITFFGVMALENLSGARFLRRLHHPVRVGRLMPTPIRTRLMARAQNMFLLLISHNPFLPGLQIRLRFTRGRRVRATNFTSAELGSCRAWAERHTIRIPPATKLSRIELISAHV
jgi:hypothetical protein